MHQVIPEYNLSHYLAAVTKLFIGAVSISSDRKAVTGVGTANVVSLCHAHKIPVYLFAEAIKFAHTPIPNQGIYKAQQDKVEFGVERHATLLTDCANPTPSSIPQENSFHHSGPKSGNQTGSRWALK